MHLLPASRQRSTSKNIFRQFPWQNLRFMPQGVMLWCTFHVVPLQTIKGCSYENYQMLAPKTLKAWYKPIFLLLKRVPCNMPISECNRLLSTFIYSSFKLRDSLADFTCRNTRTRTLEKFPQVHQGCKKLSEIPPKYKNSVNAKCY